MRLLPLPVIRLAIATLIASALAPVTYVPTGHAQPGAPATTTTPASAPAPAPAPAGKAAPPPSITAEKPATGAKPAAVPAATTASGTKPDAGSAIPTSIKLVDLNAATADQLTVLPGIGKARAEAIIKHRPYKGKDDLVQRRIIPQNVYDGIKDKIVARQG